jgi:hypothetical protein
MNETEDEYAEMAKVDPLVMWIEKGNHRILRAIYKFLLKRCYVNAFYYKTAEGVKKFARILYKHGELNLDALNYRIAKTTVKFTHKFRKLQTGVHSWNIVMLFVGMTILIVALMIGGMLK